MAARSGPPIGRVIVAGRSPKQKQPGPSTRPSKLTNTKPA